MALGPSAAQRAMDKAIQKYNYKPEILTAIVKQRKSLKGRLGYLFITSVDPQGMHVNLLYHPPPSDEPEELKLEFDPPLKSPRDFEVRMKIWEAEAKKHYNIPERPPISYYSPPPLFPLPALIILGLSALFFADFAKGYYADLFRAWIVKTFGRHMIRGAEAFAAFMHLFSEPLWMSILLRRHSTPWSEGWKWICTVFLLGGPAITEFNECVEYERICHIYKQTDVGSSPLYLERKSVKDKTE